MGLGEERDLVPLGAGFDITKRGYSRAQVEEHLERVDAELQLLHADRNAAVSQAADLAKQLEAGRTEVAELRGQVQRLSLPPTTLEGLSERLQRMLRLAQEEATETRTRAETEASHIRADAETAATALRQRYDKQLAELDARRTAMEAEHRGVVE
ncbi:MAG: DivIVA domain-containing protein, partial [Actinomycetota bacterium]|nr:DivIVA domain-containing protein [Actinomycetota bacterium]